MRASLAAAAVVVFAGLWGCSGSSAAPASVTVSPASPAQVSGPTLFTATVLNTAAEVGWSLSGPGSLTNNSGKLTTYKPPAIVSPGLTATLTATAGSASAVITLQLHPATIPAQKIAGLHAAVQVTYDAQDIPHIACTALSDCFAVQGYLQARDRLFQMDLFRRTARGRLSSLVGLGGASSDQLFLTFFTTRDAKRIEDLLVASTDADALAKLNAFVSGINAYIGQLKADPTLPLPDEYARLLFPLKAADIPDWTAEDSLAIGRLQQFQLSESISKETDYGLFAATYAAGAHADPGKFNTWIRFQPPVPSFTLSDHDERSPAPPAARAAARPAAGPDLTRLAPVLLQLKQSMASVRGLLGTLGVDTGSNNWVVDGAHSANGKAMVANDPHLSLQYPPLFHLAALTASDGSGFNLLGGSFPGLPGALIGRGAHVGWGVTVVGYDVTDLYQEELTACPSPLPAPPACFATRFDDGSGGGTKAIPLKAVTISVNVRTGVGASGFTPQDVTVLVVPHHGPIVSFDAAGLSAISMRWTGHEVTPDLRGFLNLNNAKSVGDLTLGANTAFAALKDISTGAQNFVLADDQGHIGYDPHALVPKRNWVGTAPHGRPLLPWLPLPGDGSAEWGSGVASDNCAGTGATPPAAACWVPDGQLPSGVDPPKGYFATANSDPKGYIPFVPPYLSFDWDDPTGFRHARIVELLKAKSTGGNLVSLADMQAIQSDHSVKLAAAFLPSLAAVDIAAQTISYKAALALLNTWQGDNFDCPTGLTGTDPVRSAADPDPTHARDSAACLLFHTFIRSLLHNVFDDDLAVAKIGLNSGPAIRGMLFMLSASASAGDKTFCNDVDANGALVTARTCNDQLVRALGPAFDTLTTSLGAQANWLWGKHHTLSTISPASPLITTGFVTGPFARPGGALTVDVGNPTLSQSSALGFAYGSGSNVRFISVLDPAAAVTKMQLPGPERDVAIGPVPVTTGPHLLEDYVVNTYFDYAFGDQVLNVAAGAQTFTP